MTRHEPAVSAVPPLTATELADAIEAFLAPARCTTPAYGIPGTDHCAACCYGTLWADVTSAEDLDACRKLDAALTALRRFAAPTTTTGENTMTRTDNDFLIGSNGRTLAPVLPMVVTTRQQAYRTAAWLKLMGEVLPDEDVASTYAEVEHAIGES